jgi:transposase-like protein
MSSAETFEVKCPHCKKSFRGELLGANEKQGFKCPHCRLFVPYERATVDESA